MRIRRLGAGLAFVLSLLLAGLSPRPLQDNSVTSWFPQQDPHLAAYRAFQERFGSDEVVVAQVAGGDPSGLLRLVGALTSELEADSAIERVISASSTYPTEFELLSDPELGGLENLKACGWILEAPLCRSLGLLELKEAPRATVFALLAPGSPQARSELRASLDPFRARAEREGRSFLLAGQPLVNVELDQASLEVERVAMPLLVLVCVVALVLTTRSLRIALALLLPVGLGVFCAEGLLGLSGGTSNLVVGIAKPLVFVLLLACGFHVAVAFGDGLNGGLSAEEAAWRAARRKGPACLLALLTTAVGFGSLAVSDVIPVRTLGWVTAGGLALGAPLLLLLLPQVLALSGVTSHSRADAVGPLCARLAAWGGAHWLGILVASLAFVIVGAWAAQGLQVQPHAIDYFPAGHALRRDHDRLQAARAPLAQLEAVVSAKRDLRADAQVLEQLDRWARGLEALPTVRGCVSLPLLYREAGYRSARRDSLPAEFLLDDIYERREDSLRPFVADQGKTLRFSLSIDTLGPDELEALRVQVQDAFREEVPTELGLSLSITGSYELLLHTQAALLGTLRESLLLTALLMQLVLLVALRSLRLALAALLPNAFPVAAIFLVMRGAEIPVDVATSMTAAIALGIAVDDTLHFLHGWRGHGTRDTALGTGRAIVFTSLVVGLGFLAITTSSFLPTRYFGLLCAVAMLAALVGDLLVLPAALRALRLDPPLDGQPREALDPQQEAHAVSHPE